MSRYFSLDPVRREAGFTLIEMMVSVSVLLVASAGIFTGIHRMTRLGETINNRSMMHSGMRNATELMQQEVGQAGAIVLPGAYGSVTMQGAVISEPTVEQTVQVSSIEDMFIGEKLLIGAGDTQETVAITQLNTTGPTLSGVFLNAHNAGEPITVQGGFAAGIVPPAMANGSTPSVLKMFGDVNGDGQMVYIEYSCDTANGFLYRNEMPFDQTTPKLAPVVSQILLNNIQPNPDGTDCFTYEVRTVVNDDYVIDVAITLTVRTERRDPQTGAFQTETKALLNVAPRNVFEVWQMATMNMTNRVQPIPASVTALLP
jgi:prepilin-type N-terminal cleavage/methylation domain-containing protein